MRPAHHLLLAIPLGAAAAGLLWLGDAHLTHRDWLVGGPVFGAGLAFAFLCVRELRLAGLLR